MANSDDTATSAQIGFQGLIEELRVANFHLANLLSITTQKRLDDETESVLAAARDYVDKEFSVYERLEELAYSETGFPTNANEQIDVAAILVSGQAEPTVPRPPEVDEAIERKAWEITGEIHYSVKEYLRRTVAYNCEHDSPVRVLNVSKALAVIKKSNSSRALTHVYRVELDMCKSLLMVAQNFINSSIDKLAEVH